VQRSAAGLLAVPVAVVAVLPLPLAGWAGAQPPAQPPATQVVTAVAVGANGEPTNGYQEAPPLGNVTSVVDCSTSSPSAVHADIYYCSPTAASADVCWPSSDPESLLCLDDPWDKRMHRVTYSGPLPQVQPPAVADPFALQLDDGTRCRLRNGGAWGGRQDGYYGVYGCGGAGPSLAVLALGGGPAIDRSAPAWTVKVGPLGTPDQQFAPPQVHSVTTAWFAGAA
jgi:hypothetical protein